MTDFVATLLWVLLWAYCGEKVALGEELMARGLGGEIEG